MEKFIHHANVAWYRRQLGLSANTVQRNMLLALLAEETVKAAARGWPQTF